MAETPAAPTAADAPLLMPVGSVRALLTLAVLGTVWAELLRGVEVGAPLRDTLLLVLGYYFGARHDRPPAADALTEAADRETNPSDPLYLPRGAIRLLVLVGFGAVAWKLHDTRRLIGPDGQPPAILVLVGTFLAGAIAKGTGSWFGHHLSVGLRSWLGHVAAGATLLVVFGYCGLESWALVARAPAWVTPVFLSVIGFYLGKR